MLCVWMMVVDRVRLFRFRVFAHDFRFRFVFFCTWHRGIRYKDYDLYNPVVRDTFFCLQTGQSIPMERLNDDYCDCEVDGSDEPETNACPNGVFYCTYQKR